MGHRVAIKTGDLVQLSEVIAEPEGAITLWDHHDWARKGAMRWLNDRASLGPLPDNKSRWSADLMMDYVGLPREFFKHICKLTD